MKTLGSLVLTRYTFEVKKRKEIEDSIKGRPTGRKSPSKGSKGGKTSQLSPVVTSPLKTPPKSGASSQKATVQTSGGKSAPGLDLLVIEELLDIPIPVFTLESLQRGYYGQPLPSASALPSVSRPRQSEEAYLGKRDKIGFEDVFRGLSKKILTWGQVVFSKRVYEHLKERPFLLDN